MLVTVLLGLSFTTMALGQGGPPPETAGEADSTYGATPDDLVPYKRTGSFYWRYFEEPPPFRGTGREKPPPSEVESVKIGLIAPLDNPYDSLSGEAMLFGATLAVDEANARGGFRGTIPFELVVRNDSGLWGATSNTMVELAYQENVWAVVGSIDGANSHIALRVALKAEVPMVNTACTDPTLNETAIPWILCCYPDDRQHGYRLAHLLFKERGHRRVAILRSNDKYGRMGVGEFTDAARRLGSPITLEVRYEPGETEFASQLERIRRMGAEAVVLWSNAADAGRIVAQMRTAGMAQPVFGTDRLVSPEFFETAASAAEGVLATYPLNPESPDSTWLDFQTRYSATFGKAPGAFAAFTYDGMRILLNAVERSGLNRARIRDRLAEMKSFEGVGGALRFDATHNNLGKIHLLEARNGEFVLVSS